MNSLLGLILNIVFCASEKAKAISEIQVNSYEIDYPPVFDFNKVFHRETMMTHFKNIIEKSLDDKLITACIVQCQLDKIELRKLTTEVINQLEKEYNSLDNKTIKAFYRKIDYKLLLFFYMKIIDIINNVNCMDNMDGKLMIWRNDIKNLEQIKSSLLGLSKKLKHKDLIKQYINSNVSNIYSQINELLQVKISEIESKVNRNHL
ncbi:hypothetical protein NUSPORA_02335 [Nucleospora cyclopteri]